MTRLARTRTEPKQEKVSIYNPMNGRIEKVAKIVKSDDDWKRVLTVDEFEVIRDKKTEQPPLNRFHDFEGKGLYQCAACSTALFSSESRRGSRSGLPVFSDPVSTLNITIHPITGASPGEIYCARCDAYLGQLMFEKDTGKSVYCVNSTSLAFLSIKK